jgi:SAM-dependent methyltransferase
MNDMLRFTSWIPPTDIPGLSFLDIGCSDGEAGLYVLSNNASKYVGIDIDLARTSIALKNIETHYPNADASIFTISIEEFLQQPSLKFDVIFLGRIIWGFGNLVDILTRLSKISNNIVIESVNPPSFLIYDEILSGANLDILHELEYNHPVAEIYKSDYNATANTIIDNRYLCTFYSIGYLKTVFNQLGFTENLDAYEKLKKEQPNEYGYGMNHDKTIVKKFVIHFKLIADPLPITWAEWHSNV